MKTNKVVIEIRNGQVWAVHQAPHLPALEVVVIDHDNIEQGERPGQAVKVAEGEIKNGQLIEVL